MRGSNGQLPMSYYQEAPTLRVGDFLDPSKNLQYFSWSGGGYETTGYVSPVRKMSFQEYSS